MEETHRQLWLNNLANHRRYVIEQHNERMRKRAKVTHGYVQDNFCDVCGLNTKVYVFECEGDEAMHMYCFYCAGVVTEALETFIRSSRSST